MRIVNRPPHPGEGWQMLADCTFCLDRVNTFVIMTDDDENLACICVECSRKIAQAFLDQYPELLSSVG